MTAPLQSSSLKALDAEVFLIAWLRPLATSATAIGTKRWTTGLPFPYRTVKRVTGPRTQDQDLPVIWVDTFAATYGDAAREAGRTDERMQTLVDYPGWDTVLPDGRVAHCDWAEISEVAHEEPYAAESVVTRFASEYRL